MKLTFSKLKGMASRKWRKKKAKKATAEKALER